MKPNSDRHIHIHKMESIRIIRRKDIWIIIRGGQSTKSIYEATEIAAGSRSGVYRHLVYGRGL